ncbi:hypothetical protein [Streptomyces sp. AC550_RSS872]|uniref:hypothetical protein n=1 Tax=Streptomyces sp. AC550_RSS872 TaxID=2823689 RepID=UPI001C2652FA|nr:hypothetical protein [Streptomyces sp. AC550_RSS872]
MRKAAVLGAVRRAVHDDASTALESTVDDPDPDPDPNPDADVRAYAGLAAR